jgi:hypothetical protein
VCVCVCVCPRAAPGTHVRRVRASQALAVGPFLAILVGLIGWRVSDRIDQWFARRCVRARAGSAWAAATVMCTAYVHVSVAHSVARRAVLRGA